VLLCVLCGSRNKQRELTDFMSVNEGVLYELNHKLVLAYI